MTGEQQKSILIVYADYVDHFQDIEQFRFNSTTNDYLKFGYSVLHVVACNEISQVSFYKLNDSHFLLMRPNLGYDFGSWAQSLDYSHILISFEFLVFSNSSLLGPFTSPVALIQTLVNLNGDVKAVVESFQIVPHFQSYMWTVASEILFGTPQLLDFLSFFKNELPDRELIIKNGELTFPKVLKECNLSYVALFPAGSLCSYEKNPSLDAPEGLIRSGFPYLKKALFSNQSQIRYYQMMIRKYFPNYKIPF